MPCAHFENDGSTAAANAQMQIYQINNMFDCFQTGGANAQPTLFDQLVVSGMYTKYRVYGVKVDMKLVNLDPADPVFVTTYASGTTTDISQDSQHMKGQFNSWSYLLGPCGAGNDIVQHSQYYRISDYLPNASRQDLTGTSLLGPVLALSWLCNLKNETPEVKIN